MTIKVESLLSKLESILDKIDFFDLKERNMLILRLSLGLDGHGTRTIVEVKEAIDEEFPDQSISTERVRVVRGMLIESFQRVMEDAWDDYFESLYDYVYSQCPIEVNLLAKRLVDPTHNSFKLSADRLVRPFSEVEFHHTGLLKILESRPTPYLNAQDDKVELTEKRVYFHSTRDENTHIKGRARNTKECIIFLCRSDLSLQFNPLLAHAEKAVRYNGLVQEQILVPLISRELPIHHREQIANSIFSNHKDFLWLDEKKGWLTLTNNFDNRIVRNAVKIFSMVDSIHVEQLSRQISRAVRPQTRSLRGESRSPDSNKFLSSISFGSDREFTTQHAIAYFVGAGLCKIDHNDIMHPTQTMFDSVNVDMRWSEKVMVDTLKNAPEQKLSKSDFQAASINALAESMQQRYLDTLETMIKEHNIKISQDGLGAFSADLIKSLTSKNRANLDEKRKQIERVKKFAHNKQTLINSEYVTKRKAINAEIAANRKAIRQCKVEKDFKKLKELEVRSSAYRLLLAECGGFASRGELLDKEIARLSSSVQKLNKTNPASELLAVEEQNLLIAKRHKEFVASTINNGGDRFNEIVNSLFTRMHNVVVESPESDLDTNLLEVWVDEIADLNNISDDLAMFANEAAEHKKRTDLIIYQVLTLFNERLDTAIEEVGEPNDKFEEFIISVASSLEADGDGVRSVKWKEFEKSVAKQALEAERTFAASHFTFNISYSPLIVRVRSSEYSIVGSQASAFVDG